MWHCGFVCKEANKVQFKDEINQGSVRERHKKNGWEAVATAQVRRALQ